MTVAILTITQTLIGVNTVRVTWTSGLPTPTFRVWRDGVKTLTTVSYMDFYLADGEMPVIEVFDDDTVPSSAYPGNMLLFWYHVATAAKYRVEEYVGSEWVTRCTYLDEGQGSFLYRTDFLADETTYEWRIVPVGENGNDGTPFTRSGLMVRYPDVPSAQFTYSEVTNKVTVTIV